MTPRQITLVQTSFEKVVPIAEVAAELFYTRLFEIEPSLKGLFHGDMADQGRKLMTAMSMVVNGLDKLERILPMVQELDRRHGFTVAALQTGTPLNVVSKWLGHAQLKTDGYLHGSSGRRGAIICGANVEIASVRAS